MTPDHEEIVRRVLITARIIALREVAADTSKFFEDARRETGLPPRQIVAEMEAILDRERDRDPLG
jgi:hypothetical protein